MINRQIVDISRNLSLKAKIPFAYLKTFRATLLESVDFDRLFYWFRFVSPRKAMSTEKSLFSRKRSQVITRFERFQGSRASIALSDCRYTSTLIPHLYN